jgi:glucose-1-phosphate thymidylyltransferase
MGELTKVTNKHLLPVGPYPMVYHPLKKLVSAGIQDILLVSGTEHMGDFVSLLGSGREHQCSLTYRVQDEAGGIAQALGLAERFCGDSNCVVLLGDNIFENSLAPIVDEAKRHPSDAFVLLKKVHDPHRYGVAEVRDGKILSVEEKPKNPKSDLAITGIYIYPNDVFEIVRTLRPSGRGELEITDVNTAYLRAGRLRSSHLEGYWTDAGTLDSLVTANQLVHESAPVFSTTQVRVAA